MLSYLLLYCLAAWKQLLLNHLLVSINRTNPLTAILFFFTFTLASLMPFPASYQDYKFKCSLNSVSNSHCYIFELSGTKANVIQPNDQLKVEASKLDVKVIEKTAVYKSKASGV
jgi:hypothetical protein